MNTARISIRTTTALGMAALGALLLAACTRDAQATESEKIGQQYGVAGAQSGTIATTEGSLKGTLVPITLASGRQGMLFIPQKQANDPHAVYIRDEQGLHPVQLGSNVSRGELTRSPGIVGTKPEPQHQNKRSWEKDVLIVGGSTGAGTAIGALAGGKKGAAVGATTGGVGGLIYDLLTRDNK